MLGKGTPLLAAVGYVGTFLNFLHLVYDISNGVSTDRMLRPSCRRSENPKKFWWLIGGETVLVVICVVYCVLLTLYAGT